MVETKFDPPSRNPYDESRMIAVERLRKQFGIIVKLALEPFLNALVKTVADHIKQFQRGGKISAETASGFGSQGHSRSAKRI